MSFSFLDFEQQITGLINEGYSFIRVSDYFIEGATVKTVINRIDVDFSIDKAWEIARILKKHNIKASWYFRFSCPKYNLFEYSTINLINYLKKLKHEIGLHTELVDLEKFCFIDADEMLIKQKHIFENFFNINILGTASHGDITGNNNLDFWKTRKPSEFGLLYEAYDESLWNHCRYVSDSEWIRWKSYNNGIIMAGDERSPIQHAKDNPDLIYLLTHPDTYYNKNIHEG
ncbi:hypothetical protein [Vibrio atypicus]|uniref:hypothetical protein n=1 Tax=Vibrio atypicus TaxID=558271 RepID=UPI00135AC1E9|nr:hypothetical protein [Vibrio atypicus]